MKLPLMAVYRIFSHLSRLCTKTHGCNPVYNCEILPIGHGTMHLIFQNTIGSGDLFRGSLKFLTDN